MTERKPLSALSPVVHEWDLIRALRDSGEAGEPTMLHVFVEKEPLE